MGRKKQSSVGIPNSSITKRHIASFHRAGTNPLLAECKKNIMPNNQMEESITQDVAS